MHQPYYKDDLKNIIYMPWVFLHAIKDYYELPWLQSQFPKIKATYNLVPSLLVQLKEYESFDVKDRFLMLIKKEPQSLSYEEKSFLLCNLFHANPHTMIKPLSRYYQIYLKRNRMSLKEQIDQFSHEEILDLEVLFLLAWCGNYLRENNEIVKKLLKNAQHFSQDDKIELLNALFEFIKEILPFYQKLQNNGQIELSTTPFYHPILPLLVDMQNGVLANKDAKIPSFKRALRSYADIHVELAVSYFKELFGFLPKGFWPAEGSISSEALEILADNGAIWAASDEEIIFKTKKSDDRGLIYKKYWLHSFGRSIGLLFRDKALSDAIGFIYYKMNPKDAVNDFISRLRAIYEARDSSCVVPVILDGENAWESYENNAKEFFIELYSRLSNLDWCECVRFLDIFENGSIPTEELYSLEPGSWIGGDFHIWLGEPEENRAWEYLYKAHLVLEQKRVEVDEKLYQKAKKELLIAQGSDWFWWYGDDHYTPLKDEFDFIFRTHLINIYELLSLPVPNELYKPISKLSKTQHGYPPKNSLSIILDGKESYFFEWKEAGYIDLTPRFGAMSTNSVILKKLFYGIDESFLFLRIDGELKHLLHKNVDLILSFIKPIEAQFTIPLKMGIFKKDGLEAVFCDFIESKIELNVVWDEVSDELELVIYLLKDSKELEVVPIHGSLNLQINRGLNEWYI